MSAAVPARPQQETPAPGAPSARPTATPGINVCSTPLSISGPPGPLMNSLPSAPHPGATLVTRMATVTTSPQQPKGTSTPRMPNPQSLSAKSTATFQLPANFQIPPGTVLIRSNNGQLMLVSQQALARAQAHIQSNPRPPVPTNTPTVRLSTVQSATANVNLPTSSAPLTAGTTASAGTFASTGTPISVGITAATATPATIGMPAAARLPVPVGTPAPFRIPATLGTPATTLTSVTIGMPTFTTASMNGMSSACPTSVTGLSVGAGTSIAVGMPALTSSSLGAHAISRTPATVGTPPIIQTPLTVGTSPSTRMPVTISTPPVIRTPVTVGTTITHLPGAVSTTAVTRTLMTVSTPGPIGMPSMAWTPAAVGTQAIPRTPLPIRTTATVMPANTRVPTTVAPQSLTRLPSTFGTSADTLTVGTSTATSALHGTSAPTRMSITIGTPAAIGSSATVGMSAAVRKTAPLSVPTTIGMQASLGTQPMVRMPASLNTPVGVPALSGSPAPVAVPATVSAPTSLETPAPVSVPAFVGTPAAVRMPSLGMPVANRTSVTIGVPTTTPAPLTIGMPATIRVPATFGMSAGSRMSVTIGTPANAGTPVTLGMPGSIRNPVAVGTTNSVGAPTPSFIPTTVGLPAAICMPVTAATQKLPVTVSTTALAVTTPAHLNPAVRTPAPTVTQKLISVKAEGTTNTTPSGQNTNSTEMLDNVKKCKNFLATLIKLASSGPQAPEMGKNVKTLVQHLLESKIEPEEFTKRLYTELKSSPQPYLVPFLKKSLPSLRQLMPNSQDFIQQCGQPQPASQITSINSTPIARTTMAPAVQPVRTVCGTAPVAVKLQQSSSIMRPPATSTPQATMVKQLIVQHPSGILRPMATLPQTTTQIVQKLGESKVSVNQIQPRTFPAGSILKQITFPGNKIVSFQASPVQKTKIKENGISSLREEDDINDVTSMAGVNLNEENACILATNSELVGRLIRSSKEEPFLSTGPLQTKMLEMGKKHDVLELNSDAVSLISYATQERLRGLVEKLTIAAQHRAATYKGSDRYIQSSDTRSQLKFLEQLDHLEKRRKNEEEREMLLRAAKSRSNKEDPEQLRLKQKAKEMQQLELAQMQQREANLTALAAIGPRRKRALDSSLSSRLEGSHGSTESSSSTTGGHGKHLLRPRTTRVCLRDLIFCMEQEREMKHSLALYRAHLK
ncbi:transcription initiation factor TFIID subunit 4B-like isoform X2 [Ambystoma mexicanum]|uniref:transcription initiation factor TFIID subunit 4B-like isoform X2 n=1 Tax=Ambystoma mexicanum TaxID=8296 RepID=UPI0037E9984F